MSSLGLGIGGTSWLIQSDIPLGLPSQQDGRHYENFEEAEPGSASVSVPCDIEVGIRHGGMPSLRNFARIYQTGTWSSFLDGDRQAITLQPADADRPLWTALSDAAFSRVQIFLNEAIPPYNPVHYPLDQILLMHHLALRQGTILHAAGLIRHGQGYIFPGVSGAGKTTASRLFMARADFFPLSDDRVVVRREENGYRCYGTPWPGEAGVAANREAELAGIFLLRQARENAIEQLSGRAAFERLLPVASIPWYHRKFVEPLLEFFLQLVRLVPVYEFSFTPTAAMVSCLEHSIETIH